MPVEVLRVMVGRHQPLPALQHAQHQRLGFLLLAHGVQHRCQVREATESVNAGGPRSRFRQRESPLQDRCHWLQVRLGESGLACAGEVHDADVTAGPLLLTEPVAANVHPPQIRRHALPDAVSKATGYKQGHAIVRFAQSPRCRQDFVHDPEVCGVVWSRPRIAPLDQRLGLSTGSAKLLGGRRPMVVDQHLLLAPKVLGRLGVRHHAAAKAVGLARQALKNLQWPATPPGHGGKALRASVVVQHHRGTLRRRSPEVQDVGPDADA
mmetsp:Transcript_21616/g.59995  ORF Transcript_21616/g.59995 Transcript_21616/m.59995 type:complete len:266 (+) Transcript_21616:1264-2061(+)